MAQNEDDLSLYAKEIRSNLKKQDINIEKNEYTTSQKMVRNPELEDGREMRGIYRFHCLGFVI